MNRSGELLQKRTNWKGKTAYGLNSICGKLGTMYTPCFTDVKQNVDAIKKKTWITKLTDQILDFYLCNYHCPQSSWIGIQAPSAGAKGHFHSISFLPLKHLMSNHSFNTERVLDTNQQEFSHAITNCNEVTLNFSPCSIQVAASGETWPPCAERF